MTNRTRIFVLLSLVIALSDGLFVLINNSFSDKAFKATLVEEGKNLHSNFETLLSQTYENLLIMATYIANDEQVQTRFLAGKKAVEAEGGGPGKAEAAAARQSLYDVVGETWGAVQKQFHARQLHFHLGPGSTSFLRVHRPDKFGDNMDNVRFTIVDTNTEKTPRVGFETGRVYSGLRGVVPVTAWDSEKNQRVHVGALEAGTSFDSILNIMSENAHVGGGVLLTRKHITSAMWPDFIKKRFGEDFKICECGIEAHTSNDFMSILQNGLTQSVTFQTDGTDIVKVGNNYFMVSHFPLRDYQGAKDPTRKDVGAIVFWRNANETLAALHEAKLFNIIYGIFGYFLIEVLLFFAFRYGLQRLEAEVGERTLELSASNETLARQAAHLVQLAEHEAMLVEKLNYEVGVKNRFFSIIAHDLKSPFNGLLGLTQMMTHMADELSREKLVEYAKLIHESGNKTFELVSALLDWAQLQMDGDTFKPQPIELHDITQSCFGILAPTAARKNITLVNNLKPTQAFADKDMILTVIRNLLSNAIKFTPDGGTVNTSAAVEGDHVNVTVSDHGVGMTADYAASIFALDIKTTTPGTDGEKRTGLGLPLCKEMVEKCGGKIWCESVPDKGSTFTFTLPVKQPRDQQDKK